MKELNSELDANNRLANLSSTNPSINSIEFCQLSVESVKSLPDKELSSPPQLSIKKVSLIANNLRRSSSTFIVSNWYQYQGFFYLFCSSIFFSLNALTIKHLIEIHPTLIAFARFNGQAILTIAAIPKWTTEFTFGPSNVRYLLITRSICGGIALLLRYNAFLLLSLAEVSGTINCVIQLTIIDFEQATLVKMTIPAFVMVLSIIILKEKIDLYQFISFLLLIVGILLSSNLLQLLFTSNHPHHQLSASDTKNRIIGLLSGLASSVIAGFMIISLRKLKNVDQSAVLLYSSLIGIIEMTIFTYIFDAFHLPNCGNHAWYFMLTAVFSYFGQSLLKQALACEEAIIVSNLQTCLDLIIAFMMQIFYFHEMPNLSVILGAILMLIAVIITMLRKCFLNLPNEHRLKMLLNRLMNKYMK